jgi:hypothetical protein
MRDDLVARLDRYFRVPEVQGDDWSPEFDDCYPDSYRRDYVGSERRWTTSRGAWRRWLCAGPGYGGKSATAPTTTAPTTTSTPKRALVSHAAPKLEALLPSTIDGHHRLAKGSATGAVVLSGHNASSQVLKGILARPGRTPSDLRFANAQDASLGVEVGAFRVLGSPRRSFATRSSGALARTLPGWRSPRALSAAGARPSLPIRVARRSNLYPHRDVVYYVGTQDAALATRILHRLG